MDSLLLEDFGQKVDLTKQIWEVLLNNPEGTTVLKEVIQNADDAGATKVHLCLDRHVHGLGSLLSESLAQWQGLSLSAYNDVVFTEEHFINISRISGNGKHGQAWKTRRFGNPEQVAYSRLSRQAYFEDDISLMLDQLFEEGVGDVHMGCWRSRAQNTLFMFSELNK